MTACILRSATLRKRADQPFLCIARPAVDATRADIIEQIVDDRNLHGAVRASDALPDRVGAAAFGSAFAAHPA